MIYVILRGDLGNQLFEYAVGRRLALAHRTKLVLILSNRLSPRDWRGKRLREKLQYFELSARLRLRPPISARAGRILCLNRFLPIGTYFRETQWGFDPDVLLLPDESYLYGYFQSEAYFREIESIIRADLSLQSLPKPQTVLDVARRIRNSTSVSIHVRRGDFLKHPSYQVCTPRYYANAVDLFRRRLNRPHFFVFSDDVTWCRANLAIDNAEFVDLPNSPLLPLHDFWLMSQCRHQVIANSTFSWWAAWLNMNPAKIVVTPNRWSHQEPMNSLAMAHTVPSDWTRIAV